MSKVVVRLISDHVFGVGLYNRYSHNYITFIFHLHSFFFLNIYLCPLLIIGLIFLTALNETRSSLADVFLLFVMFILG